MKDIFIVIFVLNNIRYGIQHTQTVDSEYNSIKYA